MINRDILSIRMALCFILYLVKECATAYSAIARKMIITQTVIQMSMKEMYETFGTSDRTLSNMAIRVSNDVKFIPTRASVCDGDMNSPSQDIITTKALGRYVANK